MGPDVQELLRKGSVSLVVRVVAGLVGFIVTVVATRSLGQDASGTFFLSLTIITLSATIARFGFDQLLTRLVSNGSGRQDWDSINRLYRAVLPFVLLIAAVTGTLLFVFAGLISIMIFDKPELVTALRWMSASVCTLSLHWLHAHCHQGLKKMVAFQWFQNLGVYSIFLVLIGMETAVSSSEITLVLFAQLYSVASLLIATWAVFTWRRQPWFAWQGVAPNVRVLLADATPLLGVALIGQLILWLPQLLLGVFRSTSDVSVYNSAFRTAQLTAIVLMAGNSITLPKLATLFHQNEVERLRRVMVLSTRLMAICCLPFIVVLLWFPVEVLALFGKGYGTGANVLRILALGQFFNVATGSVGGLLNMTGRQRSSLRGNALAFCLLSVLCILLIPKYGIFGAAIAQAASLTFQMTYFTWVVHRDFGFFPLAIGKIRTPSKCKVSNAGHP
ncbi:flippase [Rhodopirellula europaea]|uniref:flippase n=1 Tax=Rhodopirellula europaea TaxID=1263866 RepID=UPI003D2E6138